MTGKVHKDKNGKYTLVRVVSKKYSYQLKETMLDEDLIFERTMFPHISQFEDNTIRIWRYAFTEMVNNVLDHSEAEQLTIYIAQNELYTWVNIVDDGIGIFKKIADYYDYHTLDDAIISLFKGKLTTDSENHSGEGIFFTSRVMDHYAAISGNKIFSQNNTSDKIYDIEESGNTSSFQKYKDAKGTIIVMGLTNHTQKTLREVFDMYSNDDGGFTITSIPMKMVCDGGYPVSRSQAKRLYFGFDKFEKVILDFSGVDEIGQGFAHELFCVFRRRHPKIEIECIHTNEAIDKMINHVTRE